jgi:hypothetical protein
VADRIDKATRWIILAAAAIGVLEAVFALRAHKPLPLVVAPLVLAAVFAAALRLAPARRRIAAAAMVLVLAALFVVESRQGRRTPRDASAAAKRGAVFDTRSLWDVIHDERAAGADAYPSMDPRALLGGRGGIEIDGNVVLPLGGISSKKIVFCNEGGAWATYDSDERGFNNPKGIWAGMRGAVDVGIVGEAFAQGACVPRGASAADVIRGRYLGTLNLGMAGNGPLLELAGIMEHLADVQPKHVLWFYYHNDLGALEVEKANPILRRYLDTNGRQGLAGRQEKIDEALAARAKLMEQKGSTWPGALAAVGLTRGRTPWWMQDLVMGEEHSNAGAALRLDKLTGAAAARFAGKHAGPPPDLATFKRVLEKAKAVVAGWGGTLHFVYLADVHNLTGPDHPLRKPVLDVARAVGLPIIDMHPIFVGKRDPLGMRYHDASHLNEDGYRLVGQTVLTELR